MPQVDATLRELTGYCMRRATTKVLSLVNDRLAPFGLRRTTFSTLSIIVDEPGIHQSRVADALSIERPNIVQIVDELEQAGLVKRVPVPGDRRVRGLQPTKDGKRLYKAALDRLRETESRLTHNLSAAEIATLQRALLIIENNAEEQRSDDVPIET